MKGNFCLLILPNTAASKIILDNDKDSSMWVTAWNKAFASWKHFVKIIIRGLEQVASWACSAWEIFDRQLLRSRALISGTLSRRIILQRGSFNDIKLYPYLCFTDNNRDQINFLFERVFVIVAYFRAKFHFKIKFFFLRSRWWQRNNQRD